MFEQIRFHALHLLVQGGHRVGESQTATPLLPPHKHSVQSASAFSFDPLAYEQSVYFHLYPCLSICILVFPSISVSFHLCPCLSICVRVFPSVSVSFHLYQCLSIFIHVFLSVIVSFHLYPCLSICILVFPSVSVSFHLYPCLSVHIRVFLSVSCLSYLRSLFCQDWVITRKLCGGNRAPNAA